MEATIHHRTKDKFSPNYSDLAQIAGEFGVDDGTRTHDDRHHKPGLYQLSYAHHYFLILLFFHPVKDEISLTNSFSRNIRENVARPAGLEPATLGLAYQLPFSRPHIRVCGLDYLFTISGAARIVSTEPCDNQTRNVLSSLDYSWVPLPSVTHSS